MTDWLHLGHLFPRLQYPQSPGISWVAQVRRYLSSQHSVFCQQEDIFLQNFQHFVSKKRHLYFFKPFSYVLSLETIVDIATLPPLFVMAFTSRQWIGFRCKTYPCLIHHLWCPFYLSFLSLAILDQIWDSINHHNCPSSDSWGLPESSTYLTCSSLWRWTIARRVLTFGIVSSIVIIFFRGFWLWLGDDICAISFR